MMTTPQHYRDVVEDSGGDGNVNALASGRPLVTTTDHNIANVRCAEEERSLWATTIAQNGSIDHMAQKKTSRVKLEHQGSL